MESSSPYSELKFAMAEVWLTQKLLSSRLKRIGINNLNINRGQKILRLCCIFCLFSFLNTITNLHYDKMFVFGSIYCDFSISI
jgi:hypothetical protein